MHVFSGKSLGIRLLIALEEVVCVADTPLEVEAITDDLIHDVRLE
jgi:hypothetical protein